MISTLQRMSLYALYDDYLQKIANGDEDFLSWRKQLNRHELRAVHVEGEPRRVAWLLIVYRMLDTMWSRALPLISQDRQSKSRS